MPILSAREMKSPLGSRISCKGYICSLCHRFYRLLHEAQRCEQSHLDRLVEAQRLTEIKKPAKIGG